MNFLLFKYIPPYVRLECTPSLHLHCRPGRIGAVEAPVAYPARLQDADPWQGLAVVGARVAYQEPAHPAVVLVPRSLSLSETTCGTGHVCTAMLESQSCSVASGRPGGDMVAKILKSGLQRKMAHDGFCGPFFGVAAIYTLAMLRSRLTPASHGVSRLSRHPPPEETHPKRVQKTLLESSPLAEERHSRLVYRVAGEG